LTAGTFVVGGGAFGSSGGLQQAINTSIPIAFSSPFPNAWRVDMNNASSTSATLQVYAVCAPLTNPSSS
jgi:hypothetical protein